MLRALAIEKERAVSLSGWEAIESCHKRGVALWVDITSPTDAELERLRDVFAFHPLAIADCRDSSLRAKVKDYDTFCFVVIPAVQIDTHRPVASEVDVFLGSTCVVSVHRDQSGMIDRLFAQEGRTSEALRRGPDFLLHALLDTLVDDYFPAMDNLDTRIAFAERQVFTGPGQRVLDQLLRVKREILYMRRLLGPLRDALSTLVRRDFPYIRPECRLYFQDLYDHMIRLFDMVDTQRELISSAMEAHLSSVSNRLNEVMKVLTIIATIMMPLQVVTGFYGMNVAMPEFSWPYGRLWAVGLMVAVSVVMLTYFRRRNWL